MRRLFFCALLLLLIHGVATADLTVEELGAEGPLAAAVAEYLRAFNAADEEALSAFIRTRRDETSLARTPLATRVERQLQMRGMTGPLEPVSFSSPDARTFELVAYATAMQGHVLLSFEASSLDPVRFGMMGLRPTEAPDTEVVELTGAVSERIAEVRESRGLPALGIAWWGDESGPVAFLDGVRNLETGDPVRTGDLFHYGSITKSMTSCIAARLVDRGLITYGTTLAEGLPGVWLHPDFRPVTLELLLQHRSGIEPLLQGDPAREARWTKAGDTGPLQRRALAAELLSVPPSFGPGTSWSYSNAGYVVVALMLEAASGSTFEQLIQAEVFEPLGLSSCGLGWPATEESPDQPRGHWPGPVLQSFTGYDLGFQLAPAGDAHGSVSDLVRYAHALATAPEGWIRPDTLARMFTDPGTGYAMGLSVEEVDGRRFLLHNGSAGTFFAVMAFEPATGQAVAVVMNEGSLSNDALGRRVARALFDGSLEPR